jgi:hypothetical protein
MSLRSLTNSAVDDEVVAVGGDPSATLLYKSYASFVQRISVGFFFFFFFVVVCCE